MAAPLLQSHSTHWQSSPAHQRGVTQPHDSRRMDAAPPPISLDTHTHKTNLGEGALLAFFRRGRPGPPGTRRGGKGSRTVEWVQKGRTPGGAFRYRVDNARRTPRRPPHRKPPGSQRDPSAAFPWGRPGPLPRYPLSPALAESVQKPPAAAAGGRLRRTAGPYLATTGRPCPPALVSWTVEHGTQVALPRLPQCREAARGLRCEAPARGGPHSATGSRPLRVPPLPGSGAGAAQRLQCHK